MDTHVRIPQEIFLQPQHLVVPPFQRPYVWDKDEQWSPLWQDVRRLADSRLVDRFSHPTHFLGGSTSTAFAWQDADDQRSPADMLLSEGVAMVGDRADRALELSSDDLPTLIAE